MGVPEASGEGCAVLISLTTRSGPGIAVVGHVLGGQTVVIAGVGTETATGAGHDGAGAQIGVEQQHFRCPKFAAKAGWKIPAASNVAVNDPRREIIMMDPHRLNN
ncbi:MAG: hypothetical protein AAFU85_26660 [Planctomycetota bacterium]